MRSDRLKQVMQEIDPSFDEKNLGISKFSRFCQEAAQKGVLTVTKLENGQLEVDLPEAGAVPTEPRVVSREPAAGAEPVETGGAPQEERPNGRRRGRRGGRGRAGDRESRETRVPRELTTTGETAVVTPAAAQPVVPHAATPPIGRPVVSDVQLELSSAEARPPVEASAGTGGDRLTRGEAFDLVKRTVADLVRDDESVRASAVRARARQLLGRDSESLSDRMFVRILKDAHDEGIIDLRRRGNDFEVARAAESGSVADQVAKHEKAAVAKAQPPVTAPGPRLGMGPRGAGARHRPGAPPPELLAVGVVEESRPAAAASHVEEETNGGPPAPRGKRTRGSRAATKTAAKRTAAKTAGGGRSRGKKGTSSPDE
jgi:hypothetical protein